MFRWGVLSAAKIARTQLLPAIAASENGRAAAIASRRIDAAQALARQFSIPTVYPSYDALLASDAADGVYIAVATADHMEWAEKALAAGKHVLCEKPVAIEAREIDRLIALRDASGLVASEAFMVAYHPQWRKVRALIADGAIGPLRRVEGAFAFYNADPQNTRNQLAAGGGALRDIGVYPVVTTRLATAAEPRRVRADVRRDDTFGVDVDARVAAEFDGFDLVFYCSTRMALRQSMVFHGESGLIEVAAPFNALDYGDAAVTLWTDNRSTCETFRFPGARQYQLQVEAFARAAQEGETADLFPLESSRANQAVIDAAFRSGGAWVEA